MPEFISLLRKIRDIYYPQIRGIMDTVSTDFATKRNEFSTFVQEKTTEFGELATAKTNSFTELFNSSINTIDTKRIEIVTYISEQRIAISSTISDFTTYATGLMSSLDNKKDALDTVATQLDNVHVVSPVETLPPINGQVANAEVEYNRLNGGMKFKIPAGRNGEDLAIDFVVANDTELYALTMDSANAKYVHTGSVAYREDTEMIYVKKDTGQNSSSVDWTDGAPLTPTTLFKNLSDTPADIEPNKFYKGNLDGTALEQVTPKQIAETQELQDIGNVSTTLTGHAKKVVVVNDTEDGFEYSDDTPNALLLEGKTKQEVEDETIATLRDSVDASGDTLKKLDDKKAEKSGDTAEDFSAKILYATQLNDQDGLLLINGSKVVVRDNDNKDVLGGISPEGINDTVSFFANPSGTIGGQKNLIATPTKWEFDMPVKIADATANDEAVNLGQMKNRFPFLIKKITGTTADTEGGTVNVAHGLTGGKIISISCKVENGTNGGIFPNGLWAHAGSEYSIYHDSTNVRIENHNTESENILSKPFILTIMHEE